MMLILAGHPREQVMNHKANGIDEFIYMGSDSVSYSKKCSELSENLKKEYKV